jgi:17beta-estradiol 17-dehydrogenase / very-long-chain 3-oxoacyl-CoA reductase
MTSIVHAAHDFLKTFLPNAWRSSFAGSHALLGFSLLGAYTFARWCLAVPLRGLWRHVLRPRRDLKARYQGQWALVTGGSDGIGEAYCHELARSGFNIVIVSRTQEKMEKVARELYVQHRVQTKLI